MYTEPPAFPKEKLVTKEEDESLRKQLLSFSHEQLVEECLSKDRQIRHWKRAASSLLTSMALTPDMTEAYYARALRELLSSALETLDVIEELRHIECSMPCLKGEAPRVSLVRWCDLQYSEWHVEWSPTSWWLSVSAVGCRWGIGFNCLTNVRGIFVNGVIRCAFAEDMTALRLSFLEKPILDMDIESSVGWGAVPIPVREQIEHLVRAEIEQFVEQRVTGRNDMVIALRAKVRSSLSENDLQEARLQAERAKNVQLRSTTFLS